VLSVWDCIAGRISRLPIVGYNIIQRFPRREIMEITAPLDIEEVYYLKNLEQLQALSDPIRYSMVVMVAHAPMTGAQLARALDLSRARAHYHLKLLEKVGLVRFYGEDRNSGIVEKYYVAVGRMFDFTHLLPTGNPEMASHEVTARTLKNVTNFIVTMLDVSRQGFLKAKERPHVEVGFYYTFESWLKPDQYASLKAELNALKDRIIQMGHENEEMQGPPDGSLVKFRTNLFLTMLEGGPKER